MYIQIIFIMFAVTRTCADYTMFIGGKITNTTFTVAGAYDMCRNAANNYDIGMKQEAIFPFIGRASELSTWDDNAIVRLPDGRPVYNGSQLRTRASSLDTTLSNFAGPTNSCGNCWMCTFGMKTTSSYPRIVLGLDFDGFATGPDCTGWTTSSGTKSVLYFEFSFCEHMRHVDSCPDVLDNVYLLCMWDMTMTNSPTVYPTHSPTGRVLPQNEPIIDYSFSQMGCKEGNWAFDDGIAFTRMPNATSCAHKDGFRYLMNGAYNTIVDGEQYMDSFASNEITNQMDSIIMPQADDGFRYANMTFMLWITKLEQWSYTDDRYLMDIGPSTWQTDYVPVTLAIFVTNGYLTLQASYYRLEMGTPAEFYQTFEADSFFDLDDTQSTFVFAVSIENPLSGGLATWRARVFGWKGFTQNVTRSSRTADTSLVGPLTFQANSRFRFNTYRYSASAYTGTIGTVIHRVAMWNRYIDDTELANEARYGMPKSIASCRNWSVEFFQGDTYMFSLNSSDFTRDFDNDTIVSIRIHSLPSVGVLTYNGSIIEYDMLPIEIFDNVSLIEYESTSNLSWSYPDCSATMIEFDVSDDGTTYSLEHAYASICIAEVNYAPVVTSVTHSVPRGSTSVFDVKATDLNDRTLPPSSLYGLLNSSTGGYRNTSFVAFHVVMGDYGSLFLDDCETPIDANETYPLSVSFCYVSMKTFNESGLDQFSVYVSDTSLTSSPGTVGFNNTNPLFAAGDTVTVDEYPAQASFRLPLFDGLDRTDSLAGQVLSLPQHGTLRFTANESLVAVGDLVDGNLTFTGKENFFTQYPNGVYVNFYGESLSPPDSFMYRVMETISGNTSEPGVMYFNVTNVFSDIVSVSGLDKPIEMTFGTPYKFGTRFQINDPDNQQYRVGVYLSTIEGEFVCDINQTELKVIGPNQNSLLLSSCGLTMDDGCSELYLAARPRYVNYLLTKMSLELSQSRSSYSRVNMRFYKPGPDGITPGNFESEILYGGPQISAKLSLDVSGTDSDKDGGSSDSYFWVLISPFLLILAGFLIVCSPCLVPILCYACICGRGYRIICYVCNGTKATCGELSKLCRRNEAKVKADPPDTIESDINSMKDLIDQTNSTFNRIIAHLKATKTTAGLAAVASTSASGGIDIYDVESASERTPLYQRRRKL